MVPTPADEVPPLARRVSRALVWLLLLLVGLLTLATVARVTNGGGPSVDRLGTASVDTCAEYGPVSLYGVGTTYRCTAEVRWSDGKTEQREFPAGQLGPADAGHAVPVYQDIPDGIRGQLSLGRNGSARYTALGLPATLGLGFLVVALGIGTVYTGYRVFRPRSPERTGPAPELRTRAAQQEKAARRESKRWPVTKQDRAAVAAPKITWRLRLLAGWCVLAVLYALLATIPQFDAPRALEFVSPWPQIERAELIGLPPAAFVVLGLILTVILAAMAGGSRTDAARVVRHGPAYLGRNLAGKGSVDKRVAAQLERLAARQRAQRLIAWGVGIVLLALATWATIRGVQAGPSGGPPLVWLACLRDAVLLAALALIWLSTVETRFQRLERLLRRHRESFPAAAGTVHNPMTS